MNCLNLTKEEFELLFSERYIPGFNTSSISEFPVSLMLQEDEYNFIISKRLIEKRKNKLKRI